MKLTGTSIKIESSLLLKIKHICIDECINVSEFFQISAIKYLENYNKFHKEENKNG